MGMNCFASRSNVQCFVNCIEWTRFFISVLLPGGGTFFNQSRGYADAGAHIYRIAKKINGRGIHFPVFGTCLGFEFFLYAANDMKECRTQCSSQRQSLPLEFTDGSYYALTSFHLNKKHILKLLHLFYAFGELCIRLNKK